MSKKKSIPVYLLSIGFYFFIFTFPCKGQVLNIILTPESSVQDSDTIANSNVEVFADELERTYHLSGGCVEIENASKKMPCADAVEKGFAVCPTCIKTSKKQEVPHGAPSSPSKSTLPNSGSSTYSSPPRNDSRSSAVQCSAITQQGNRCKRMTTNSNGRCYQH